MSGSAPNRGDTTDLPVTHLGTLPGRSVNAVKQLSGNVRGFLSELHSGCPRSWPHADDRRALLPGVLSASRRHRVRPDSASVVGGLT
jgi:hypothetical protein